MRIVWGHVLLAGLGLPWWLRWLEAPAWTRPARRAIGQLIFEHQAIGLFGVVFAEELGIPLPVPGDVAIMTGGYLTTTGRIPLYLAYIAVVSAATAGATVLFWLSRRYGHRWVVTVGAYIGISEQRLGQAEQAFARWGPWAIIIGRLIPGMRIVMSALAGVLQVPYRVFIPSVFVSSLIWAAVFIELGRHFGRRTLALFRLLPAHLLPLAIIVLVILGGTLFVLERSHVLRRPHRGGQPAVPERRRG